MILYGQQIEFCVEVMVVKKKVTIVLGIISIVAISTMIMFSIYKSSEAYRKANAAIQWDCSVTCAEESTPDSYAVSYTHLTLPTICSVMQKFYPKQAC